MDSEQRKPRVLLCDDSPVERLALGIYLRRNGFEVDEAEDGEAALQHLKNRQIDLLLLDLNMPQKDGFSVLSYIQEHRRALPVVLMSGMEPDEIQHKMHVLKERELPPLFIKPIDPEALVQVMELQLRGELPGVESDEGVSHGPSL